MSIPVWVNNHNRLAPVKAMVEKLRTMIGACPIIIDNASSYPPLLEWYQHADVEIVHLGRNGGPYAPWTLNLARGGQYYAVTDPDLDLSGIPENGLMWLISGLQQHLDVVKAGFSLEVDDLPNNVLGKQVRDHEARFWTQKSPHTAWWLAPVDTTFAVYFADSPKGDIKQPAIRADRPYTARHLPWYLTPETMTEEDRFYFKVCGKRWGSWANRIMQTIGYAL